VAWHLPWKKNIRYVVLDGMLCSCVHSETVSHRSIRCVCPPPPGKPSTTKTFSERYAEDLAKSMKNTLLVGRVAYLARNIEQRLQSTSSVRLDTMKYYNVDDSTKGDTGVNVQDEEEKKEEETNSRTDHAFENIRMSSENKMRIIELLGAFEDPLEGQSDENDKKASISAIIQFRHNLSRLNTAYPFGITFGPAGTRGECIESIEAVYRRLLLHNPKKTECLHFNTIAAIAVNDDGELDEILLRDLVKLYRPDRDGNLRLLDFAKSIDGVYKDLRLLRASVASLSRVRMCLVYCCTNAYAGQE
jgi:hypothetical protein